MYRADVQRITELTRQLDELRADATDLERRADALDRELRQLRTAGSGSTRRAMAGVALGFGPFFVMAVVLLTLGRDVLAGDPPGVLERAAPVADTIRAVTRQDAASEPAIRITPRPRSDEDQDAARSPDAVKVARDGHGYLTIVCNPFCDEIMDGARALGPSPILRQPVTPGEHRLTLRRKGIAPKHVSIVIRPGESTASRVRMK
jgi:hypothetical protein